MFDVQLHENTSDTVCLFQRSFMLMTSLWEPNAHYRCQIIRELKCDGICTHSQYARVVLFAEVVISHNAN